MDQMIKVFKTVFWIVLGLIILAIPPMAVEIGLRFFSFDRSTFGLPFRSLTVEETKTLEALSLALIKSGKLKWTHSLIGSRLVRKDADWSKNYPGTYGNLRERITKQQKPNRLTVRSLVTTKGDGKVVFDVHYTLDKQYRRLVPETSKKKTDTIILSGCSYTFGIGLNDRETIQYALGQLRPSSKIFNLGLAGSSISEQFRIMDLFPHRTELPHIGNSIGVYIFTTHQLNRAVCGRECLVEENEWMLKLPRYTLENNLPTFRGNFNENFPWSEPIAKKMAKFEIFDLWPGIMTAHESSSYKLFATLLREYEVRLKMQAGISELIVVNASPDAREFVDFQKELTKIGMKSVDLTYAHTLESMSHLWNIPVDNHFAPPGAYATAWLIDHHLKKMGL